MPLHFSVAVVVCSWSSAGHILTAAACAAAHPAGWLLSCFHLYLVQHLVWQHAKMWKTGSQRRWDSWGAGFCDLTLQQLLLPIVLQADLEILGLQKQQLLMHCQVHWTSVTQHIHVYAALLNGSCECPPLLYSRWASCYLTCRNGKQTLHVTNSGILLRSG